MALPGNPSTRHVMSRSDRGKEILYVQGSNREGLSGTSVPPRAGTDELLSGKSTPGPHRTQGRGPA